MNFEATPLDGAFLVDLDPHEDERGFFARSFCEDEFEAQGLVAQWPQCNVSYNARKGTLRGLHYNAEPFGETKLVRCTTGAIYDVIVDLRPDSATTLSWMGFELSAKNRRALYVPEGFAHGFITLEDDSEVFYQMSNRYVPRAARGLRFDDPAIGVRWPIQPEVVSTQDQEYADIDVRKFIGAFS